MGRFSIERQRFPTARGKRLRPKYFQWPVAIGPYCHDTTIDFTGVY
jgi:hypothetical protein